MWMTQATQVSILGSPTPTYTYACVLSAGDRLGPAIRRTNPFPALPRANFGLRMRQEGQGESANVQGTGPWLTLGLGDRALQARLPGATCVCRPRSEASRPSLS